jgi:glycosyltransferase involved in cell wall biosynthesis
VRVAFFVPAYGVEILGGAEYGARMIAEHLAAAGHTVEVFTSRAREAATWADHYPAGTSVINGVAVHRFQGSQRARDFEVASAKVLASPSETPLGATEQWIEMQGPVCTAALDAVADDGAEAVVLYPYLYWPTVHGARRLGRRCVMQPAAHDERPIYLPLFRDTFNGVGGLMFQTEAERRFVERLFPATVSLPHALLGLGVEVRDGGAPAARRALDIGDRPYLVCLGRVNELKGTTLLTEWWAAYKRRRPGPLALVLAGPVTDPPPRHPDIVLAGPVDEETKWGALRGAEALILPSPYESFSIALIEAWTVGKPALVNAACLPTAEQCRRSGGGLAFDGYSSFESIVDRLVADAHLRRRLGAAGAAYAAARYSWDILTPRYEAFLGHVASLADR